MACARQPFCSWRSTASRPPNCSSVWTASWSRTSPARSPRWPTSRPAPATRSSRSSTTSPWPGSTLDEGGLGYAKALLEKALPKDEADRVMQQIEHQVHQQPFSFLQKAESENLLTFMQDEHPQTIALILAHLPPQQGQRNPRRPAAGQADRGRQPHRQHGADQPRGHQGGREGAWSTGCPASSSQKFEKVGGVDSGRRDAQPGRPRDGKGASWRRWRPRTPTWSSRSAG